MVRENSRYSHSKIVEWLKEKVQKGENCCVYEHLKEIPELSDKLKKYEDDIYSIDSDLPIDIICVEDKLEKEPDTEKEKNFSYYTLFLVASTNSIPKSVENRILFYKFYLSKLISPKRFKIVLVAVDYIQNINENFFQENGIGFWKFVGIEKEPLKIFPPMTLREQMAKEFEEFKKEQKSENVDIPLFFDKYIHDAVNAIGGVRPEQFGERHVDKKVMDKIFDLKKICYRQELSRLVNEQLTGKNDEYEFANLVFTELWDNYIGIPYSKFLKSFEPGLQYIFAETMKERGRIYRDHYLHQLQVFLLGLPILDNSYKIFKKKYNNPELGWLIASSFHDMAYPVQEYDVWGEKFFNEVFNIKKSPVILELKSNFVDHRFLCCMGYLIDSLCCVHFKRELKSNWLEDENDLVQFFYKEITEAKNHGILSSISFLKMIQPSSQIKRIEKKLGKFEDVLQKTFVPSALAIAIHDDKIWSAELGKAGGRNDKSSKFMQSLKFEDDPLSFLLIFCDNIQEWGRPSKSQEKEEDRKGKKFYLKEFICTSEEVKVTIWTPDYTKKEKFFTRKQDELRKIQSFLQQSPSMRFSIRLEDKTNKGEDFYMEGSAP